MKTFDPVYITIGKRTVYGTDWPVENKLEKIFDKKWRVTYGICNGTASGARDFKTKQEANDALLAKAEGGNHEHD